MSSGISFAPGQVWLVRSTLANPLLERVAERLAASDAALAHWVERGIYAQSVPLRQLEPPQREQVRQAVVTVTRELLTDRSLFRSLIGATGVESDREPSGNRRELLHELLELAESEKARRFAAGDSGWG